MNIPVVWLSYKAETPARGYWDQGMIESFFAGTLWRVPNFFTFEHHVADQDFSFKQFGRDTGAVIILPARSQAEFIDKLNEDIKNLRWVLIMLTGDEESVFPYEKIEHKNKRVWVMSPRPGRHKDVKFLGTGWPGGVRDLFKDYEAEAIDRPLDWFFSGQITHERRQECAVQMTEMLSRSDMVGEFYPTKGFTEGLPWSEYAKKLSSAKVAPCPSGPETPDSFRLFESLEAGCIPIADTRVPKGDFPDDYWHFFFGEEPPFPVITTYDQLTGYTLAALEDWHRIVNRVFSWWMKMKRKMAYDIFTDICELTGLSGQQSDLKDNVTVIVPTSPSMFHPDTTMIERTINDIRTHLPNSEIIITFDGIRSQQEHYRPRYVEYIRRTVWKCHHKWSNVIPIVFEEHMHQAKMMREALKLVTTPVVMYVEHDAPITPDTFFDWPNLIKNVLTGEANVIRFHHEASVLPDHEHMMLDSGPETVNGVPMRKTRQWSQRPHLASTAFYRQLIDNYFNPESKTMIEDVIHGIVDEHCKRDGLMGWNLWRLWIYHPEGGNIKRSYHIDGRGTDPKYEMEILPVRK